MFLFTLMFSNIILTLRGNQEIWLLSVSSPYPREWLIPMDLGMFRWYNHEYKRGLDPIGFELGASNLSFQLLQRWITRILHL